MPRLAWFWVIALITLIWTQVILPTNIALGIQQQIQIETNLYSQSSEILGIDEKTEELEDFEFINEPQINWSYKGNIWTQDDFLMVRLALNHISKTINKSNIRECVTSRTLKYEGVEEGQAMIDFDSLANAKQWPNIIITAKNENARWAGQAFLERIMYGNLVVDNDFLFSYALEGKRPKIDINLKHLHFDRDNYEIEVAYKNLAGVVLHELLHQMGHAHPRKNLDTDYTQGHFINVAGDCLTSDGRSARGGFSDSSMSASTGYYGSGEYIPKGGWRKID
jgi:hypothetical protein